MEEIDNRTYWVIAIFLFVGITGATIQARGALVPTFETFFGVSKSQLGLLTPVGTVGYLVAMLTLGSASGRVDVRRFLLAGVALTGVSLLALGAAPGFLVLLGLVGMRSLASGVFRALDRPTLSHLYPESRARMINLQEMTWAIGATAGPLLVTAIVSQYSWRATYLVLAALTVPVFVLIWRLDAPTGTTNERSFGLSDLRPLLAKPGIYGMVVALVFVGSIESIYFTWLPSYADATFSGWITGVVLSIYLAAYVPGRWLFSRLSDRFSFTRLLVVTTVLLTGLTYLAFSGANGYVLLGSIFGVGLLVSGLFPTLISMGIEAMPSFSGPVNVVANVATQIGFSTAPVIVGVLADATSIETAILVQIGLAGLLALVMVVLELGPTGTASAVS
ncbi:putative major facilitator superfamily transporter protein [Halorhabdus tiamatea SARL4B]|uniref:Putative major facilitator superfamily transporter protein n=1 Tax=Halorhabdus tiamatea SARL4B TaxID=1033806 RepID=U2DK15_9EURY|nr:MFS transporter [Halorhabdus tiamatea]ERJ04555.1 putative major facilitator superfamily transporter protein [Halorhabdus tiamatea SARL4B]ERJ06197.1 putative major facilitator superfamily transporter protein [Halorhabdus tiamatea SARL4B]